MRSLIRQVLWLKCGDDRFVFLQAGDQSISHSTPRYSSTMPHYEVCKHVLHLVACGALHSTKRSCCSNIQRYVRDCMFACTHFA